MKVDLYTKVVLTVIAASLVVISFRLGDSIPPAHAANLNADHSDVVKVQIVGVREGSWWDAIKVKNQ